jgi:hypothetical protein
MGIQARSSCSGLGRRGTWPAACPRWRKPTVEARVWIGGRRRARLAGGGAFLDGRPAASMVGRGGPCGRRRRTSIGEVVDEHGWPGRRAWPAGGAPDRSEE